MDLKNIIYMVFSEELIELLAAIEHEKWLSWTDSLCREGIILNEKTRKHWISESINYTDLSIEQKEYYRQLARRTIELLSDWISGLPTEIKNLIKE